MAAGSNLQKAKVTQNDEFYTQLTDIEHELKHYIDHFRGKVIYCNCDDPGQSNFWRYFHLNFTYFGLKKLIATHYRAEGGAYTMEYTGENDLNIYEGKVRNLKGTGDFRDEECAYFERTGHWFHKYDLGYGLNIIVNRDWFKYFDVRHS